MFIKLFKYLKLMFHLKFHSPWKKIILYRWIYFILIVTIFIQFVIFSELLLYTMLKINWLSDLIHGIARLIPLSD